MRLCFSLLTGILVCTPIAAQAQSMRDWNDCSSGRIDAGVIAACTRLIQSGTLVPTNLSRAFNIRGNIYNAVGAQESAIEDFSQAIRIDPNNPQPYNNRGNAYGDIGEYDRAIADFNQAIRMSPNSSEPYNGRGNAYQNKGDYDLSIADFDQALRLATGLTNKVYAYSDRGLTYVDMGAYDRAILDLNQALSLAPGFPAGYMNRGNAYTGKGEYNLAIADYTEAISLVPNYPQAYNNRGNAYEDEGAYDLALADYDHAIQLGPNSAISARPYANRGILRWKHGSDADRSIADIELALKLDPKLDYARTKLDEIRNARAATNSRRSGPATPGKRVALVIGNSEYKYLPHLGNATADARDVATALRGLGFEVKAYYDLSSEQTKQAVEAFGSEDARTAETALVWYSGHGRSFNVSKDRSGQPSVQNDDYILPVDFAHGDDISAKGVTVGRLITDVLSARKLEIVVIDACRPLEIERTRPGLSEDSQPVAPNPEITPKIGNLLVVYSTQPNRTASDGPTGGHSPFAQSFLDEVARGDAKNDVRGFFGAVGHETQGKSLALGEDQRPDIVDDIASGSLLPM